MGRAGRARRLARRLAVPVDAYLAALNEGAWDALAERLDDADGLERMRAAVASWQGYEERPLQIVRVPGAVALRTRFGGITAAGIRVELEPLTVLELDGSRILRVASWHAADADPAHAEIPAVAVVGEYFRASNEEDWDAFTGVWTDDALMAAVGGPPRRGRDAVVRAYRLFLGLFPRHADALERLIVSGRTVTAVGRFCGTNPQGIEICFPWVDVIDLDAAGRRIERLSHWHDRELFHRLWAATELPAAQ